MSKEAESASSNLDHSTIVSAATAAAFALRNQKFDLPSIPPSYRLNGRNYLGWSKLVYTLLRGKDLEDYLTVSTPEEGEIDAAIWEKTNANVRVWLWDSMDPNISSTCLYMDSAKEI
ncbi:unnamed protein product, partial [Cuscuta europaea]